MRKTVIVMGKGTLAIRIADWFLKSLDYHLVEVVPVIPEPAWTDSFAGWARSNGIPVIDSGHYKDVSSRQVDLVFSVFYDRIIKEWFIARCRRILNLHNAPLPFYRGVSPINWALKNNERKHGVTIHEITPRIDDGPIVAQLEYTIYPSFDEVGDVYHRALAYGWVLFQQTMPLLDRIEPEPQDHFKATHYCANDNPKLGDRKGWTRQGSIGESTDSAPAVRAEHQGEPRA